jgi:phosphonate transport system substrate-binding protein
LTVLRGTTILADVGARHCEAVFRHLAEAVGSELVFVDDVEWPQRQVELFLGNIQLGTLCSLTYARQLLAEPVLQALGAPCYSDSAAAGQPVYYSRILCRENAEYQNLGDLRGSRFGYNEPESLSGYIGLTEYMRQMGGRLSDYFGELVATGSHQRSLEMLAAEEVDVVSVDHYVYELSDASLTAGTRTLTLLGPHPSPPLVCHRDVPEEVRATLAEALLTMHEHPAGRTILEAARIARFEALDDKVYLPMASYLPC